MPKPLSRRDFLKISGVKSAGILLAACGISSVEFPAPAYSLINQTGPRGIPLHVLTINPERVKFYVTPSVGGSGASTTPIRPSEALIKYALKACWNGDGFIPTYGSIVSPNGTWASQGQVYKRNINEDTLYIDQDNNFTIYPRPAALYNAVSFPIRLVTDGIIYAGLEANLMTQRTAMGWNGASVFVVVCDGGETSNIGMTKPELAAYMLSLGCTQAINLDGGGSSAMALVGQGLISAKNDSGNERAVANVVGIY